MGCPASLPIAVDARKTYFDTNVTEHHHFLIEGEDQLVDVPGNTLKVSGLPAAPNGYEAKHAEVIVRLKRKPKVQ